MITGLGGLMGDGVPKREWHLGIIACRKVIGAGLRTG